MLCKFRNSLENISIASKAIFVIVLAVILIGCSQGRLPLLPTPDNTPTVIVNKATIEDQTPTPKVDITSAEPSTHLLEWRNLIPY